MKGSGVHALSLPVDAVCTHEALVYAATSSLTGELWVGRVEARDTAHAQPNGPSAQG